MLKYRVTGHMTIQITPVVLAEIPMTSLAAALMLAELYQRTGDSEKAIQLLESLGSLQADVIFALSLAELYDETNRPNDVIRVTEGFSNADDASAQLLVYRAEALRTKGLNDSALAVLKEALKSRIRDSMILRTGRYLRGLVYEEKGKRPRQGRTSSVCTRRTQASWMSPSVSKGRLSPASLTFLPLPLNLGDARSVRSTPTQVVTVDGGG